MHQEMIDDANFHVKACEVQSQFCGTRQRRWRPTLTGSHKNAGTFGVIPRMAKMTLTKYVGKFSCVPWDDEEYAQSIVENLPGDLPVVRAAQAYLDACHDFDDALEAAGIDRG